jgi:hypothetical protein
MIPDGDAVTDPVGTIVTLVAAVGPAIEAGTLRRVVEQASGGRAKRRRLAAELAGDPSVLSTGRSPASKAAGDLLLALRAAGATGISPPWCAECGREVTSMQRRGDHWYCSPCFTRPETCGGCGSLRKATFRDRHGRPRCSECPDEDPRDPRELLVAIITSTDPGLDSGTVSTVLGDVVTKAAHLQKLAWALDEAPGLLTGDGARAGFPMVLRLIDALCEAGATRIHRPACPLCGRVVTLNKQLNGQRVCRSCVARSRAVPCSQCGRVCEPATRTPDGQPLCPYCLINDPANLEDCIRCGRRQRVATRTPEGPVCCSCNPRQVMSCTVCGRTAPCMVSKVTGQPWCGACARSWACCSRCGNLAPVKAGTRDQPLCAGCAAPGADLWKACPGCGDTGRLLAGGACRRCHLRDQVDRLLADPGTGRVRVGLEPLRQALAGVGRPEVALGWIRRDKVRALLTGLATGQRPLTHAVLDELPDSKSLRHLRSVLVASGALPARDEHLTRLEHWIRQALAARHDAGQHLLHSYAVWHVLRRLRQRARATPVTQHQASTAKENVTAAMAFLDWLDARDLTLATCAQGDLDTWMASASTAQKGRTGNFVRWARNRRHTRLDFPATRWNGPARTLDTEDRWNQARRLLHDEALKPEDRFAGLLVLLYAQQPAAISRLTLGNVHANDDRVLLHLGQEPVLLPEPLDGLARLLIATRQGHATIGDHGASPWLLPGGRPGQPISPYRLAERLHQIGIQPGPARSTALFQLAAEVPAAILARMLGVHINVAVAWQHASNGDWAPMPPTSAAGLLPQPVPSRHETRQSAGTRLS